MWGRFSSRRAAVFGSVQALRSAFGGAATTGLALAMAMVFASIGWFSDSLEALLFPKGPPLLAVIPLLILVLVVGRVLSSAPAVVPEISQHSLASAKVLIWFLSPPNAPPKETNSKKMRSWRMAHEAISALGEHGKLERVVVIVSADLCGDKQDGSWRHFEDFRKAMSASTGVRADKIVMPPGPFQKGVDFEDAKHLYKALEGIYADMKSKGYNDVDIVLDVTGGQKMPAVLGGIIGLGEGRRIQYVSTRDYKIHEYDITYRVSA